jgi:hypothetical protein
VSHCARPFGAVSHSAKGLLALRATAPTGGRREIPRLSQGRGGHLRRLAYRANAAGPGGWHVRGGQYPAAVVLPRLIRRSAVRTATNAELFGGNRETLREWLSPDHPVCSAAATFRERREYLFDRTARSPHIRTVRFTAQREFEHWYELL